MTVMRMALAAAAALGALTTTVSAQDWPTRPITLIVPFAAGGGVDASARLQAVAIGEALGQTIVIENVGAAAGTIGSGRVAKAVPDGYTMLIGNSGTQVYSQGLYKKRPYFTNGSAKTLEDVLSRARMPPEGFRHAPPEPDRGTTLDDSSRTWIVSLLVPASAAPEVASAAATKSLSLALTADAP